MLILSDGKANLFNDMIYFSTNKETQIIITTIINKKPFIYHTSFMSMLEAPASREFSISSFTTFTTDVMTCELDSSRTVSGGSCFMTAKMLGKKVWF